MAPRGTKRPLSDAEDPPSPAGPGAGVDGPGLAAGSPGPAPSPAPSLAPSLAPTPTPSKKKLKPLPATPSFQAASLTTLRAKAVRIQAQLEQLYPNPPIPLTHASHFQLLVAVMLSAQSTDVKVNTVTPELFRRGPDAAAMAKLEVSEIEAIIRVLGLAPTKAKNVRAMSQILVEQYGGQVPGSWEGLEALPGVGHKTASVVMSQAFGHAAFPVDTHIHRLAQRWGLSNGKSVEQTEQDLKTLLPEVTWRDAHLQIIYFGREHCPAQRHDPAACPICSWAAPGAARSKAASKADAAGAANGADAGGTPASRKRSASAATKRRKVGAVAEGEGEGANMSQGSADEAGEVPAASGAGGDGAGKGRAARVRRAESAAAAAATAASVAVAAADASDGGAEPATEKADATVVGAAAGAEVAGVFDAFRAGPRGKTVGDRRRPISAAAGKSAVEAVAAARAVEAEAGCGAGSGQGGAQSGEEGGAEGAGPVRRSGRQAAKRGGKAT
ncbi:hypothetical protein HXX76_009362 [Chlamydomonas incerta]|uniref:HhH-GPD domain-containing protein n=1 Tax=Chlamydomonas incerta TaxID=51695 RepID=A0A835T107_CHLIN|nr:hypothetical protein HXX76_009362 [Chlamydomonas incerta]|eukprot:KAG2431869.1 hypothetical protein HXX76_009362 [Chlamydomonas incerta]